MRGLVFVIVLAMQAAQTAAQSMSADDIRRIVDQRLEALGPFRALLTDPEETRAVTAMEIMMGADDPALRRMALEYGLFSPSTVVQRTALDAFFATGPTLGVQITLADGVNPTANYRGDVADYSGSVADGGVAYFPLTIGAPDSARQCFLDAAGEDCLVRNSDAGVAIRLWGNWWQFAMDEEGRLMGGGNSRRVVGLTATIPVAF